MSGGFSAGGLITGIDSNSLISQIIQFERQPIFRLEDRVSALEETKQAVTDLRSTLLSLRNAIQDFRLQASFSQFASNVANESILAATVTGANPPSGLFTVDVTQLATATVATSSARIGAAIDPNAPLANSGATTDVTTGTFTINGQPISFDATTQSLNDVLNGINATIPAINATYDAVNDRVVIQNVNPGDTTIINFGASTDDSNFLEAFALTGATQFTNGNGATELTSTRPVGAVNQSSILNQINFAGGAISGGSIFINGIQINVDPTIDTLGDLLARINTSDAGVTATFDVATDTIRVVSDQLGSRTIAFAPGTSNALDVLNLTGATQTVGQDAQFTIDGGPVQTRNSNNIVDAIPGVTLDLRSVGSTTVSFTRDTESIVEEVRSIVETFNEALTQFSEFLAEDGPLENDATIRGLQTQLRNDIFGVVGGAPGNLNSLLNIGFSSGESFDSSAPFQLSFDETEFVNALNASIENVEGLFSNSSDDGAFDVLFNFLDEITGLTGPLNERSRAGGSISRQIDLLNDQIENVERRVDLREQRLRRQFASLETTVNALQAQGSSLASLATGLGGF